MVEVVTGRVRALTGTPGMADFGPAWSPDGGTIAYISERSGRCEVHLVGADGTGDRQLTARRGGLRRARAGTPTARRSPRPRAAQPLRPRARRRRDRRGRAARAGRRVARSRRGPRRATVVAGYEDHATPPELRLRRARRRRRARCHAPAPLARPPRAPHVAPEDVTFRSFDGLEIPASCSARADASRGARRCPAVVYPHGGPTDAYIDDRDAKAQYFIDKGYAWLAVELPRLDGLRARLRAPQPRRRGASTTRRTASPPPTTCAASTGSTATGSRSSAAATARTWRLHGRHRRSRAPLPLRRGDVRRRRHPHLVGAGRPPRRPGPRADDGPAVGGASGVPRAARPSTGSRTSRPRSSSRTASATIA